MDLIRYEENLPANLEDLSKFILVGREKLTSVRAEIRAINKLSLAKDVMDQKKEEARLLAEALLDAETRFGVLSQAIPKQRREENLRRDTAVPSGKLKYEVIRDLGFSKKQAQRFETLAANKDLVEQVKAEARENHDIPTRSRVLDLAQARRKHEEDRIQKDEDVNEYLDFCGRVSNNFITVIGKVVMLEPDERHLRAWEELMNGLNKKEMAQEYIDKINKGIPKLLKIQNFLKELTK